MATNGDDTNLQVTPISSKPSPNPNPSPISGADSSSKSPSPQDFILSVASKIASQPLQYSDPDVWAVLTAISTKARQRRQGINMLLTSDEHLIGRTVADTRFQILSNQISQQHCKIYKKKIATEDAEGQSRLYNCGFLKDTRFTNGTYLNWEKLNKNSPESKLHHGDIISFAAPPQHEVSYAFVFREVLKPTLGADSLPLKRKADEFGSETKRLKGIGIGASDGPISLDDFRKLQRSNTELRKQLEDQVATINQLQNEHRAATELHEVEKKNLEESISKTYVDELKEIRDLFEAKQKELVEVNKINSEQKHAMVDLNERLNASIQSCTEANEIVRSQNASIAELKALLDEEREQRKEDREKAVENLTASIQRVKAEAQEELKRVSDASLRRENEQQEIINKLQESEKERCSLVETLRTKLEDTRQKLVGSDNKVRQLESQLSQEQRVSSTTNKRVQELEQETSRLRKELESEKAAREEAWAKVSALELEINAAMRDLEYEKRRLKAARERIMLRETQLRAFYSTTEEISSLFAKQQEQLKAMQRTLEDEENLNQSKDPIEEDTEAGDTIRTTDLLASEVAGSWACDTAPSCHGENDSPGSGGGTRAGGGGGGGGVVLHDSASVAAESQTGVVRNPEHEKLTKMIEIVEPEMKGQFGGTIESDSEKDVASNSDTEDCTGDDGGESDEEIEGHRNLSKNDRKVDETMDEDDDDDEATQQDSG
ncbi:putative transcription factor interactor and regulator FHA-SMAD family [Helianthus annuus]|nr:putative transcription factor interactor and regulator FHA-SMAD family [Helianthus annuus]